MAAGEAPVYGDTVEKKDDGPTFVGWKHLQPLRFALKLLEVVLSLIAFICEEVVEHCSNCGALYFFEFMSCTALLLSLVVILVYATKIAEKVSLPRLKQWDSFFTLIVGGFFLLASIIFAADNYRTTLENVSIAFGFLASFVFLIDFVLLWRKDNVLLCRKNTDNQEHRKNQTPATPENQPLQDNQAA
ncbi:CKLF-like MARVEL transmembrane domain-containing protein 6 [Lissotriton helveticus]